MGDSQRRIRILCTEGEIEGAFKKEHIGQFLKMRVGQTIEESRAKNM
jgi:hypothetical protein